MIAKLVRGRSFRGVYNYILRGEAEPEIIGGSMSGITPRELAREVRASRRLRPDVKDPVYHVSLSLPVDRGTDTNGNPIILAKETADPEKWRLMGEQWLKEMGLDPDHHQVIMVRHHNADHDHLHIVANRISLEGKVWSGWKDRLRCQSACRAVEQTHGLRHTEGIRERQVTTRKKDPNWRPKIRPRITNGEWQQSRRTKRNPYKQTIMNHIAEVCRTDPPPTHRQFISRLQEKGITAIPSVAAHADRISGYRFALGAYTYKGSTVGYPWGELQRQLTPLRTAKEYQDLRGYSRQVDAGSAYDAVRALRSAIWETARKGGTLEEHLQKDGWTVRGNIISRGGGEGHDLRDYAPMDTIRASLDRVQADKAEFRRRSQEAWSRAQREQWQPKYKPFGRQTQPEEIVYLAILAPELALVMLILALFLTLFFGLAKTASRPSEVWEKNNAHNIQARSAIADLRQQLLGLSQPATRFPRAKKKAEEKETPKAERRRGAWGISVQEVASFAGDKERVGGAPPPEERRPAPDPAPKKIQQEPKTEEAYRPTGPEWLFPKDLWGPQHPDDQDGGEDPREDTLPDRDSPQGIER